ncbi:MAG TPA: DoxX family protein [Chthoniobacterales bacterium]|nr:DoxX family protein [Chthoniobacterales bacterium]
MPGWVFTQAGTRRVHSYSSFVVVLVLETAYHATIRCKLHTEKEAAGLLGNDGRGKTIEDDDEYEDEDAAPPKYARDCSIAIPVNLSAVNLQNHKALAYGTFRFALGVVELMHGLVRLPMLAGFAAGMAKQFEGTILPGWFVYSFGCVLPFLEGLIGLALILGVFTRWTLAGASLLMSILIFGTCLRSDWNIVGLQMIYVLAFFIALFLLEHNDYSVDRLVRREEA